MPPFTTTRRVEFADTDMAGIVHFSVFFLWMEEVEQQFLRSHGLAVTMKRPGGREGFPRVAAQCDYVRPLRFDDEVECRLSVLKLGTKSVTYGHEFWLHGELAAKGSLTACYIRHEGETLKGVPIPDTIRTVLATIA